MPNFMKRWMNEKKLKSKLKQCFENSGLFKRYKKGNVERHIYPSIHSVRILENPNRIEYVFSLLDGLDPKEVKKKIYVFHQTFGKRLRLEGDFKNFVLTVYAQTLPKQLKYLYENYVESIKEMKVPIVGGVDLNGNTIAWDMAGGKPHLLIAGENGSGKSVFVRQVLTTLIQFKKPSEMHFYLCDPKFTEFHMFEDVEHVQGKVAFEMHDIYEKINDVKKELDRRKRYIGQQLKLTGIEQYNKINKDNKMPYIILGIDEFAQLKKEKDAIELIEIISAQGRAFGILLLLATQRPDREVMNGLIKQNITVRVGFRHADIINARITNTIGAEKIKNEDKGRFILKIDDPLEVQAPLLDEFNADKILKGYKVSEPKESEKEPLKEDKEDIVKEELKQLFGGEETCEKETKQSLITWQGFDV